MCGIAAIFASKTLPEINRHVKKMCDLIQHRGPDDEGYVFFSPSEALVAGGNETPQDVFNAPFKFCPTINCDAVNGGQTAFGHRRLAILDLAPSGHQPMCTEDSQLWITYNGEVYNYLEIRQELQAKGHRFITNSDTEVILQAYKEWGNAAFNRFNGMFAFVIYDRRTRKAVAVRDRFGVKPLYYWISPAGFVALASEIKQFTQLPGWNPVMNGQMVYDFLNWGIMDHSEETFFAGVKQLRGGEFLEFSPLDRSLHPQKWYHLNSNPFQGTFAEASENFFNLMEDAVRVRLRADVDVGSCLSGGLDSSTIVCLMDKLLKQQKCGYTQKTFSACSHVARFDERNFIDLVVNATDVEAHYTYPSAEQLFEECEKLAWHQDGPFSSTSIYAQWLVFKLAKEKNIKVMLDGQGADEQLAGYHGFFGNLFWDLWTTFRWKTLASEIKATKEIHQRIRPFALLANKMVPHPLRQPLRKILNKSSTKPDWLNCHSLQANDRDPFQSANCHSVLQQSRQQLLHTSVPMLLHYEDRDSMAHSVESRTPFLDYRLVEFNLSLPSDYKIQNGWTKRILRESMKHTLPEEIRLRRDKMGFVTAEEVWLKNPSCRIALEKAVEFSQGLLKPSALSLFDQITSNQIPFSYLPWRLISFGLFCKTFQARVPPLAGVPPLHPA